MLFILLLYNVCITGLYELVFISPQLPSIQKNIIKSVVEKDLDQINVLLETHFRNNKEQIMQAGWPYIAQLKDANFPEDDLDPHLEYKSNESIRSLLIQKHGTDLGKRLFHILQNKSGNQRKLRG